MFKTLLSRHSSYIPVTFFQSRNKDGNSWYLRNCCSLPVTECHISEFRSVNFGRHYTPSPLYMYPFICHTFQSTSHMLDFAYEFDVLCVFLYPLPPHIYLMCVLTYLNFDIWRSLWSLIYAIRASHSLASSIDWMPSEKCQVSTFAAMEKTKYHRGSTVVCSALMRQREKITDIHFLQGIKCYNLAVNERAVLIGPYVLIINARF
jgi:hypothetical protein